jgi:hypothetical protein
MEEKKISLNSKNQVNKIIQLEIINFNIFIIYSFRLHEEYWCQERFKKNILKSDYSKSQLELGQSYEDGIKDLTNPIEKGIFKDWRALEVNL